MSDPRFGDINGRRGAGRYGPPVENRCHTRAARREPRPPDCRSLRLSTRVVGHRFFDAIGPREVPL